MGKGTKSGVNTYHKRTKKKRSLDATRKKLNIRGRKVWENIRKVNGDLTLTSYNILYIQNERKHELITITSKKHNALNNGLLLLLELNLVGEGMEALCKIGDLSGAMVLKKSLKLGMGDHGNMTKNKWSKHYIILILLFDGEVIVHDQNRF